MFYLEVIPVFNTFIPQFNTVTKIFLLLTNFIFLGVPSEFLGKINVFQGDQPQIDIVVERFGTNNLVTPEQAAFQCMTITSIQRPPFFPE